MAQSSVSAGGVDAQRGSLSHNQLNSFGARDRIFTCLSLRLE